MWVRCGERMVNIDHVMHFDVHHTYIEFTSPNGEGAAMRFESVESAQDAYCELCAAIAMRDTFVTLGS